MEKENDPKGGALATQLMNPETAHSLEERKAVTDDALKLAKHGLKKELTKRVETTQKQKEEAYESLGDLMEAYNIAAQKCCEMHVTPLKDDVGFSFDAINAFTKNEKEHLNTRVEVQERELLFGLDNMGGDGYYYRGEAFLKEIYSADEHTGDYTIPVHIVIYRGNPDNDDVRMRLERELVVEMSDELAKARKDLQEAAEPFYELTEALKKAQKDLNDLPANMEELDMQATALRVKDMGGQNILSGILKSMGSMLEGAEFDGLSTALPEKSANGKSDEASE